MAHSKNDFEARVNAVINAVKRGDLSTVKALVEEDSRLAVVQRHNEGRQPDSDCRKNGRLASSAASKNCTVSSRKRR